jgi:hypothetical protein
MEVAVLALPYQQACSSRNTSKHTNFYEDGDYVIIGSATARSNALGLAQFFSVPIETNRSLILVSIKKYKIFIGS